MNISIGIYSINKPEAGYGGGGCIYIYIYMCMYINVDNYEQMNKKSKNVYVHICIYICIYVCIHKCFWAQS